MKKQTWVALALLATAFLTRYTGFFFLPEAAVPFIEAVLFSGAAILAGYTVALRALRSLRFFRLDENILMTVAVIAAIAIGEYAEAAAVAMLFHIGELLEDKAVGSARKRISALADIRPDTARLLYGPSEAAVFSTVESEHAQSDAFSSINIAQARVVGAHTIEVGSLILVLPHERIPLDSLVYEGHSSLDVSALTGESQPIEALPGTTLLSGMMNGEGRLVLRTEKPLSESTASRILKMVEGARASKAKSERLISRFAEVYTPLIFAAAILVALVPPLVGLGSFTTWLYRALVFLVASCPCALVISVPLAVFAALGTASRHGALVKGGQYLEALASAKAAAFDKTGTLTRGKLSITAVERTEALPRENVLRYAAALAAASTHPVSQAVASYAKDELNEYPAEIQSLPVLQDARDLPAMGVKAQLEGGMLLLGKAAFLEAEGVSVPSESNSTTMADASVFFAYKGQLVASFSVGDQAREEASTTIHQLRDLGFTYLGLLSGDAQAPVQKLAKSVDIPDARWGLLPADKLDALRQLQAKHRPVLFVGDGINDAPVLAAADCGIAMGLGTEAAMESADAVLLGSRLHILPMLIRLARRVVRLIRFNIIFALGIKALVLGLAVLGYAPMWLAVFADTGVSLLTVANSARILGFWREKPAQ
jgi:Zn2+/Cd2+-exporting ATPase